MSEPTSFAPIIDDKSKVLILGTMPGGKSLEKQQYYANPRNQFWKIIDNLFDETLPTDYEKKINFLKDKRIALWDVLKACSREGSLDANIKKTGFIGILIQAKNKGIINEVKHYLDLIINKGFYINDSLYNEVLEVVGENY